MVLIPTQYRRRLSAMSSSQTYGLNSLGFFPRVFGYTLIQGASKATLKCLQALLDMLSMLTNSHSDHFDTDCRRANHNDGIPR